MEKDNEAELKKLDERLAEAEKQEGESRRFESQGQSAYSNR